MSKNVETNDLRNWHNCCRPNSCKHPDHYMPDVADCIDSNLDNSVEKLDHFVGNLHDFVDLQFVKEEVVQLVVDRWLLQKIEYDIID